MALLEVAIDLLEKGGALAGIGGGYIASSVLKRFSSAVANAKEALKKATDALEKAEKAIKELETVKSEVQALRFSNPNQNQNQRITGGQIGEADPITRIAVLEGRMSSVEDDFDSKAKEDKKSWEEIQRAVGRIEGALNTGGRQ
jgi:chromosome segregation ATPase